MKGWSHAKWWSKRMIMVDGDDKRDDQVLHIWKRRKKQKPRRSRQRYKIGFYFGT
jgi:hypothetical protein